MKKRWEEYILELYEDGERGNVIKFIDEGPEITEEKVVNARKKIRDRKTGGH